MSDTPFSPADVARFLQEHPDFFTEHAAIFADLAVPHPHQPRTISLGERQIITLRARARDLEWQLSGLIQNASGNERISKLLVDWCAALLSETDVHRLPGHIAQGLQEVFNLDDVALSLWDLRQLNTASPYAGAGDATLQQAAQALQHPYCGPALDTPGAAMLSEAASIALLPLDTGTPTRRVGLLAIGSSDPNRFTADMATDFLQTIARLAGAALARLDADPVDSDE